MLPVAENVISAAAGYNYSIYLDRKGKIYFLGNSGIPFKKRFEQGNLVFKNVYAATDNDIFGAETQNGDFYVWGDNHSELIENFKENFICNWKIVEVKNLEVFIYYPDSYHTSWIQHNSGPDKMERSPTFNEFKFEIKKSFLNYSMYGNFYEGNLKIKFVYLDTEVIKPTEFPSPQTDSYFTTKKGKIKRYRPSIYLTNKYIFEPQIGNKNLFEHYKNNRLSINTVGKQ